MNVEKPRLAPVEAPLDLVAEPYEPLSVVVERQRRRADAILALPLAERERMIAGVIGTEAMALTTILPVEQR